MLKTKGTQDLKICASHADYLPGSNHHGARYANMAEQAIASYHAQAGGEKPVGLKSNERVVSSDSYQRLEKKGLLPSVRAAAMLPSVNGKHG